jgi:hypothetical protein
MSVLHTSCQQVADGAVAVIGESNGDNAVLELVRYYLDDNVVCTTPFRKGRWACRELQGKGDYFAIDLLEELLDWRRLPDRAERYRRLLHRCALMV